MIRIEGVDKRFGKIKVLKNVNVELEDGNIFALLGPNACGKTTLIKSILGMVVPDTGKIMVNEKSIKNDWMYRENIGYMPQIGKYPENMKVGQVMDMIHDLRKAPNQTLDTELYDRFNLKATLNQKTGTLSGGTRQKVSAYLAFLFNPDILILDEPTAGLDPVSSMHLKEKIISEKEKGKLIVITSHVLSELDDMVNQIIYMQEGEIIFKKSLEQLKTDTSKNKLAEAIAYIMESEIQNA